MLMHFGGTPIVGNLHIPMTTWSTLRPRVSPRHPKDVQHNLQSRGKPQRIARIKHVPGWSIDRWMDGWMDIYIIWMDTVDRMDKWIHKLCMYDYIYAL